MDEVAPAHLRERLAGMEDAVVVFHATWCGYSRRFLRNLAAPPGGPPILLVDVSDEDDPIWEDQRIRVVPTAARFARGREKGRADGVLGIGLSSARFSRLLGTEAA